MKEIEIEINVSKLIGSSSAMGAIEGNVLYECIAKELDIHNTVIKLNFIGISSIAATFLNTSIGQIYGYDPKLLDRIKIVNLARGDVLLKKVIDNAKEFFNKKKEKAMRSDIHSEPAEDILRAGLEKLIKQYNKESKLYTPDFVITEFLMTCLEAFGLAIKRRGTLRNIHWWTKLTLGHSMDTKKGEFYGIIWLCKDFIKQINPFNEE